MYNDLIVERDPPQNRIGTCTDGPCEKHFPEAAVMLAYAMHIFATVPGTHTITVCPDGEHAKKFEIAAWLTSHSFRREQPIGNTAYGGKYVREQETIRITPTSGIGDVIVDIDEHKIIAECKGGIVNTRHPGQISKLRRGLCEAVGLLMANSSVGRQVAVVPYTEVTLRLAHKMLPRISKAGIEIALIKRDGTVVELGVPPHPALSPLRGRG